MEGFHHKNGKFYKVKKGSGDHLDCFVSLLSSHLTMEAEDNAMQTDKHSKSVTDQNDQILFCSKIRNSMCRIHFFSFFFTSSLQVSMKQILALSNGIVNELLKDILRIEMVLLGGFFCK